MKDEEGFSLIEVIVSLALLGIIAVGFLSALATASRATFITEERQTAKNLAESQIEYVKGQSYDTSEYPAAPVPAEYGIYTANISAESLYSQESNIQKVTVTIKHQGKVVKTLDDYKVK
jgi:prepilin-type N-terminal cleavage/methylation domain-containing protein